jgi:hypothetical protein
MAWLYKLYQMQGIYATFQQGSTVLVNRPCAVPCDTTQVTTLDPAVDSWTFASRSRRFEIISLDASLASRAPLRLDADCL